MQEGGWLEKNIAASAFLCVKLEPFQVLSITGKKCSPILLSLTSVFLAHFFSHQRSGLLRSPL